MNLEVATLLKQELVGAVCERIVRRRRQIDARDAQFGPGRVPITSYMENIGWPELFGYDMNDFYADPDLNVEMQLRHKIFWADNADDDSQIDLGIQAGTGMYYDMTLFGQTIRHTSDGVPCFDPHPISADLDLSLIAPFDFQATGDMPALIAQYHHMLEINRVDYAGRLEVRFPHFHRGPLDVLVQLRGYDRFVADAAEQPERVLQFLNRFVDERLRFARERRRFLGEPGLPPTTFVADDWVNVPFVSPAMFRAFALPVYRRIQAEEGPVTGFHTCGNFEAVVLDLLSVFPAIRRLEVSGWNDVRALDRVVPREVGFDVQVINTLVLTASADEQRARLEAIAEVGRRRTVSLCAQAMVKFNSYSETVEKLNRFIGLARQVLAR